VRNDGYAHALAPELELVHGGGPEGIGRAQHHLLAPLVELGGQFADGGGFAHAVDAHHHDHVGAHRVGNVVVADVLRVVLREQLGDFFLEDAVEFAGGHVLVLGHAGFDPFDDLERGGNAHVGGDQDFFQFVEHFFVHGRLPDHGFAQLGEKVLLVFSSPLSKDSSCS
jgi:hypothetical protein